MRALDDWFLDWLAEHRTLHGRAKLPHHHSEEGQVIYRAWVREFRQLQVEEDEAIEASERLYALAHHEDRHFLTLLDVIRAMRAGRTLKVQEDPEMIARKDPLTRACPECEGHGLAVRFRQRSIAPPVLLYCVCPLGRHLLQAGRGPEGCQDLERHAWLQGKEGERYRRPPAPVVTLADRGQAKTPSLFSSWWKTGKVEANIAETVAS